MSPRTGRPKAENPLNVDLKVRFDQDTNTRLLAYCKKHGITRTEAIRRGIHLLLDGNAIRQPGPQHSKSPIALFTPHPEVW